MFYCLKDPTLPSTSCSQQIVPRLREMQVFNVFNNKQIIIVIPLGLYSAATLQTGTGHHQSSLKISWLLSLYLIENRNSNLKEPNISRFSVTVWHCSWRYTTETSSPSNTKIYEYCLAT